MRTLDQGPAGPTVPAARSPAPHDEGSTVNRTPKFLAATAALAATLALGACSSSDTMSGHQMPGGSMTTTGTGPATAPAGDSAATAHNQADVTFASSMVPHHEQAVEMADVALTRASSAEVKELATSIKAAQGPEITTMTGWLTAWGGAPMASGDHDMGGMGMDGMMSAQQVSGLKDASGAAFDRMWLQLMVKHHEGAVAMAKTQLSQGQSRDAKALAQAVIDGQAKEIATMTALLRTSM
jgi:uncharacterized protein (DUF305 family)